MAKNSQILGLVFFLSVFLLIYGGLHVLMLWRLKGALGLGTRATLGIGIFMALMIAAPLLERLFERTGWETTARLTAYIGYLWMGFVFLAACAYAAASLVRLGLLGTGKIFPNVPWPSLANHQAMWLGIGLAIAITLYGTFEARDIRLEKITLPTSKIPAGAGRVRIVQISDVHLGLIVREARLQKIASLIRQAQPDLLLSTGDLVDGELNDLTCLGPCLQDLHPRFGKFAVTGNHEFYAGLDQALGFTRAFGFRLLRGELAKAGDWLELAGVDDPAAKYITGKDLLAEKELLAAADQTRFVVLLKHQPRIDIASQGLFNLQLSGHTHRGQVFPFTLFTQLAYPLGHGLKTLGPGRWVYVSRGTGTWGPPIRFLSPPEVTIIDLVPQ